ncbi:MAG: hypothetical protein ACPL25_05025 [Ignavibacteria bacterium]
MNQTVQKTEFNVRNNDRSSFHYNLNTHGANNHQELLYKNFAELSGELLELQKLGFEPEDYIHKFLLAIKRILKIEGYLISSKIDNELVFEQKDNFDSEIVSFLFDGGIINLSLNEKRSLIVEYFQHLNKDTSKNLLIIPVVLSDKTFLVFCLLISDERIDIFNSIFPLIEMLFNHSGSYIINKILEIKRKKLQEKYLILEENLVQESSYSTAGKLCIKSFHSLKNKTQIIVSSFNLLKKLVDGKDDERLEKIFTILDNEIPEFSRSIKLISDYSKTLVSESKPVYFEFDRLINNLQDIFNASGIGNNLKFNFQTKISRSKIFGFNQKLLQAFSLLFLEFFNIGIQEINFSNEEDENRLTLKLNINFKSETSNELGDLLDEKSNIKFVRIINLFRQNSCNVITKSGDGYYEVVISIPKRSSQFKPENLNYVKNFDN